MIGLITLLVGSVISEAATVSRSGLLVVSSVTSGLGASLQVGDIFLYTLSFNDAAIDMDPDPDYAEFNGALTSFTIIPQTVRAGIWAPTQSMGGGNIYAENGAQQSWYFDVAPAPAFGPSANGYDAVMFAMGFGGLPANGDTGGGQTLGQVTANLLNYVSPSNHNYAELSFESGLDSQLATFELTTFHAPEPARAMFILLGLCATIFSRKRR